MKSIVAIYNKLDDDSPYRSDIFDLFGTQDGTQRGIVGSKSGGELRQLCWDWGQNGLKKTCKFLYWREHRSLSGFDRWYEEARADSFRALTKFVDRLLYVFKYRGRSVSAFVASVDSILLKDGRLWFGFTPRKFVLLPPDFMEQYRETFFSEGRESPDKWRTYFDTRGFMKGYTDDLDSIFSSAASQDQYHVVPSDFVEDWVEQRAGPQIETKPVFIASIQDDTALARKGLPTNNEVFWSVFSQYIGRSQIKGHFYIVERGQEYSVTDIPVNSLTERGLVYNQEVGAPYAIFRAMVDYSARRGDAGKPYSQLVDLEFRSRHRREIRLAESRLLTRAERVADAVAKYDPAYGGTDYDYVLRLQQLGGRHTVLFDLTSGLWHKGIGMSKDEYVAQWKHNLIDVPMRNSNIVSVWHYGLLGYEPFQGNEIGRFLVEKSGLGRDQYLYCDKSSKMQVPSDLRVVLLPFYDNDERFLPLSQELKRLDPDPSNADVDKSVLYRACRLVTEALLAPKTINIADQTSVALLAADDPKAIAGRFKTYLPLYPLKVAAGGFRSGDAPEPTGWVRITGGRRLDESLFVAQVTGHSMEPGIPDGSYCMFRYGVAGSRQGRTVLAKLRGVADPETGASYTVKRYSSQKVASKDGGWRHTKVVLSPTNHEFDDIELGPDSKGSLDVIAEFVALVDERG